jgi:hypothetical protein
MKKLKNQKKKKKTLSALKIGTKGLNFNREEANTR